MKKQKKTAEDSRDYRQKIDDLLNHYEEGRDIFINAKDWDHPLIRKPGHEDASIPSEWLDLVENVFGILAREKYGLDTYLSEIAKVDSEEMLYLYSTVGMPLSYPHWSVGKAHTQQQNQYDGGQMGLAYEIVINSNPSIAYCMTQNTPMMQMLVISHACFGHNSFFKGNHLFRQFTSADNIMAMQKRLHDDTLRYEEKYGYKAVEELFDAAHALRAYAVNRYTKPQKRTPEEEQERRKKLEEIRQQNVNHVFDRVKSLSSEFKEADVDAVPPDLEENLLQFLATDAPLLEPWQRNLLTQVCEIQQYFYPQRQTQLMNEGWATFWHYTLMTDMEEMGLISPGMYLEFLQSHTSVTFQPDFDSPYYSGINPYALGFAMYRDIRRICENPTDEDRKYFPDIAGTDWVKTLDHAMRNYKDESFVSQFLSPKVIRDFKLFNIINDDDAPEYLVSAIHDEQGYEEIREDLASQYRLADREPQIELFKYNYDTDRSVILKHTMRDDVPLDEDDAIEVLRHFHRLLGFQVTLYTVDENDEVCDRLAMPPNENGRIFFPGDKLEYK